MKTVISGATGLIGRSLAAHLDEPVVLSRNPYQAGRIPGNVQAFGWQPNIELPPGGALSGARAVFHLAGEPVADGFWTARKKQQIRDSRVAGTRNLVAGLAAMEEKPEVLISASAVGFYGDRGSEMLDEHSAAGSGFLADLCRDWEQEAAAATALGIRVVTVRLGVVLAPDGGVLSRMLPPFRLGAGGRLGTGKQWLPWVHIDDVVGILLHASRNKDVRGVMNAVSPRPVTNSEFTTTLGRVIRRPTILPVPAIALRIGLREMSQILLASQRALPVETQRNGYSFVHPDLEPALRDVIQLEAHSHAA